MNKKILFYVIVVSIGFILLYLMEYSQNQIIQPRIDFASVNHFHYLILPILMILFGMLIESKRIIFLLNGGLKLNWLVVPSLLMLLFTIIFPYPLSYLHFGFNIQSNFLSGLLQQPYVNHILYILTGILLVRSITNEEKSMKS
ncbi:hypothetical protein ACERII_19945 [Evansella sp. AB-rgal1]|uniref:hypothetical protein n=1 Tax=Evansella sp. AB-rgal1 TaxID=3242696 RepID=UPI00359DCB47